MLSAGSPTPRTRPQRDAQRTQHVATAPRPQFRGCTEPIASQLSTQQPRTLPQSTPAPYAAPQSDFWLLTSSQAPTRGAVKPRTPPPVTLSSSSHRRAAKPAAQEPCKKHLKGSPGWPPGLQSTHRGTTTTTNPSTQPASSTGTWGHLLGTLQVGSLRLDDLVKTRKPQGVTLMAFSTARSEFFPPNTGSTDSHDVQALLRFLSSMVFNRLWSRIWKLLFTRTHNRNKAAGKHEFHWAACLCLWTPPHILPNQNKAASFGMKGGNERADG